MKLKATWYLMYKDLSVSIAEMEYAPTVVRIPIVKSISTSKDVFVEKATFYLTDRDDDELFYSET